MKRLVPLIILLLITSVGYSQSKGSPEEKAKYLTETILKQDLKLSEEQTIAVYDANLEMFKKIDKEESGGGSIREIRKFMLERNEVLKGVFSAAQYEKFETNFRDYQQKLDEKFSR